MILYFIPGHPTRETIHEILPGRFASKSFSTRQTMRGPLDLNAGMIIAADGRRLAVDCDLQEWHLAADGRFAFGWWNDSPPTPQSLLRSDHLPGDYVGQWLVPRVRKWHLLGDSIEFFADLPGRARWNGQQWVSGGVVSRYKPVAELATKVTDRLAAVFYDRPDTTDGADADTYILPPDTPDLAAQILMINYLVGRDELAALEAFEFSFDGVVSILRVFVSMDIFESLVLERSQKKNTGTALDTSSSLNTAEAT